MLKRLRPVLIRLYPVLILLVIAAPVISSAGLALTLYNRWPWEYLPQFSDEVMYWHQAASVTAAGTGGGYYTVTEAPAPVGPFYAWGAFIPLFYGAIGAVFGWGPHSITIINLAALTLAAAALIGLAGAYRQPRPVVLLLLLIVLLTFNPLRLFGPSAMLEGLMYAFALVMAGLFDRLLRHADGERRLSPWAIAAILGFITAAALLRATWALLLIPAVLLINRRPRPLAIMGWLALAGGLGLAVVLVTRMTTAPYPTPFFDALALMRTDLTAGLAAWWYMIETSLNRLALGSPVELQLRQQLVGLIGIGAGTALVLAIRRGLTRPLVRELAVCGWVIVATFAFVMLIYNTGEGRDHRLLALALLVVLVLLALRRRWGVIVVGAATMLITAADTATLHQAWFGPGFSAELRDAYPQQQAAYAPLLTFDPAADPWCSTVNFHMTTFWSPAHLLLAVPPGFGLSWMLDYAPATVSGQPPLRSGWFIVSTDDAALIERTTPLELVLPLPIGGLYRNLAAGC